ncbi:MAG: DUF4245 family protein [Nocardioides sp.]
MTGTRSETGVTATTGALAAAAAVLLVVVGIVLVQQASGSDDAAPASAEPTPSSGSTLSESPSADEPADPSSGSEPEEPWVAEAVRAAKDGFPAFVPSEVPRDWTAGEATYEKDTSWRMEFTSSDGGTVVIDQRTGEDVGPGVRAAVGDAGQSGTVNLRRWGTGTWAAYEGNGAHALAQELAGTAVVVSGTTRADVVELTQQLLTAEMVVNVGDGSDG